MTVSLSDCGAGSVTRRRKVSTVCAETAGAVKEAVAVVALDNVTVGPESWVHSKVREPDSGSVPAPGRETRLPSSTVWSGPALAVGAWSMSPMKARSAFCLGVSRVSSRSTAPQLPNLEYVLALVKCMKSSPPLSAHWFRYVV